MATIPQVQRRRLASSLVGSTPVDTSDVELAQLIGGAARRVGTEALRGAVAQKKAAEGRQREQRQADRKLDEARASIQANRIGIQASEQLNSLVDTARSHEEFLAGGDSLIESLVNQIPDTRGKLALSRVLTNKLNQGSKRFLEVDRQRKFSEIKSDIDASFASASSQTNETFSDAGLPLEDKISAFQSSVQDAIRTTQIAREAGAITQDEAEAIGPGVTDDLVRSAVSGLIDSDPESVAPFLKEAVGQGILDPKEEAKFLKEAQDLVKRREAQADLNQKKVQQSTAQDFYGRILDPRQANPVTPLEKSKAVFDGRLTEKDEKLLTDIQTNVSAVDPPGNAASILEFGRRWSQLNITSTGSVNARQKRVKSESASFEELARLRQDIGNLVVQGDMTQTQAVEYLKQLQPAFDETAAAALDKIAGKALPEGWFGIDASLDDWIPDEAGQQAAASDMQDLYVRRLNKFEEDKGGRAGLNEVTAVLDSVREDFHAAMRKDQGQDVSLGSIRNDPVFGLVKATGYAPNGEVQWDDDITAPVDESARKLGQPWLTRVKNLLQAK